MSIQYAILGFLSWKPHTGYELKKLFADSLSFHWSGNNNQIYGTLIKLHKEGLVTNEVVLWKSIEESRIGYLERWPTPRNLLDLPTRHGATRAVLSGPEEWLSDALDGLSLGRVRLCGVFLGGWMALRFAFRRPSW